MPIRDIQYRYRELGRLRMGDVDTSGQKARPKRLDTWRLTSPSEELLKRGSDLWGGQVEVWDNAPTEGEQYELTTEVSALPVLVPPQDIDSAQFYELWTASGCKRRCDGQTDFISGRACPCAQKETRECVPTTQLLVMLPQLPDVGVWRLVSRGWNAANELPPTVKLLRQVAGPDTFAEAEIAIETRTAKTEGPKGPETHHFVVPALRLPFALSSLLAQAEMTVGQRGRVPIAGGRPELPADASFSDERSASWGEAPAVPGDGPALPDEGEEVEAERSNASSSAVSLPATSLPPNDGPPSGELIHRAREHLKPGTNAGIVRHVSKWFAISKFDEITHDQLATTLDNYLAKKEPA